MGDEVLLLNKIIVALVDNNFDEARKAIHNWIKYKHYDAYSMRKGKYPFVLPCDDRITEWIWMTQDELANSIRKWKVDGDGYTVIKENKNNA